MKAHEALELAKRVREEKARRERSAPYVREAEETAQRLYDEALIDIEEAAGKGNHHILFRRPVMRELTVEHNGTCSALPLPLEILKNKLIRDGYVVSWELIQCHPHSARGFVYEIDIDWKDGGDR